MATQCAPTPLLVSSARGGGGEEAEPFAAAAEGDDVGEGEVTLVSCAFVKCENTREKGSEAKSLVVGSMLRKESTSEWERMSGLMRFCRAAAAYKSAGVQEQRAVVDSHRRQAERG